MATALANPAKMIERGAPRLIHSDEELEDYTSELFRLTEIENPSEFELEAIELLGMLIEKYQSEHHPLPAAPPTDVLRFLIDQHGLQQRDLIPEFGSEAQVSMFLNGHRQLSIDQLRRLSERFRVDPGVFLQVQERDVNRTR